MCLCAVIPVESIFGAGEASDATSGGGADGGMCVVCFDGPKDTAVLPCKHLCACTECAPALRTCPICRQPAQGYLQLQGIAVAGVSNDQQGQAPLEESIEGPPAPELDRSLPYGGDLQAAMRAQDRDAIRQLMARRAT